MKQENRKYWLMVFPVFALLAFIIYIPVMSGIKLAFEHYTMYDLSKTGFCGLDNFKAIITDPNFSFIQILVNSFLWVFVSLFFQFTLGFTLALLLKKPFKRRGLYTGCVFYAWALSGFAIGLIWSWVLNGQFGLMNDILQKIGIIKTPIGFLSDPNIAMASVIIANVWYGIPFFAIMLLAALQSIPKELYESAQMDGAGATRRLFSITIPYVMPTIISTTLLRTMWIMNFPDIIYGMTNGGPANSTNILATQMINKIYKNYDYGQGSALGLIIIALLLVYAFVYLNIMTRKETSL